jgi:purine-nucleoside phosphorylase
MPAPAPAQDAFAAAERAAREFVLRFGAAPDIVVIESGWGAAADGLGMPVAEVPTAALAGHPGTAWVAGRSVLVLLARMHLSEGHTVAAVVHGVRGTVLAPGHPVVLTNAAGACAPATGRLSRAPGSRAPGARAPGARAPGSRAPVSRAPRRSPVLPCRRAVARALSTCRISVPRACGRSPAAVCRPRSRRCGVPGRTSSPCRRRLRRSPLGAAGALGRACVTNLAAGVSAAQLGDADVPRRGERP